MTTVAKEVQAIAANPTNLQTLGLTEADLPEIQRVAGNIKFENPNSVSEFGRDVADHTAGYADSLLDQVRNRDLDEAGGMLTEVVTVAKSLNLHALSTSRSRIPLIGPLIDRIRPGGNKVMAKFESTSAQIFRLINEVDQIQAGLAERNVAMEEMFQSVVQEHRMLGVHIAAGKQRLAELRMDADDRRLSINNDPAKLQELSDLDALAANLDKRIGDLIVLQQSAMQSLPTIRLIQANNTMLVSKFHSIREVTLPAWKGQFLLRLTLNEQRNAVKLAQDIDDATNQLLIQNSKLLHSNAVETAKANQRLVIDVDTLQKVQDNLIKAVEDVIQIQKDGATTRQQAEKQIQGMRIDLQKRLTKSNAGEMVTVGAGEQKVVH
jgi:uncharacterized protein YaaN involved in tellurite resistance